MHYPVLALNFRYSCGYEDWSILASRKTFQETGVTRREDKEMGRQIIHACV